MKKKSSISRMKYSLVVLLVMLATHQTALSNETPCTVDKVDAKAIQNNEKNWMAQTRFGMFITLGLYSIPAGVWQGEGMGWNHYAEWIRAQWRWPQPTGGIPKKDYDALLAQFNPTKFDADEWISLAAKAGMRYFVITTKHHDGFALWDSEVSDYDLAATPFESKGTVKVFILAGQSNMEGHAGMQTLDQLGKHPTHGHLLKKIRNPNGEYVVRDDVFVSYKKEDEHIKRPLSVGMGASGEEFGPELMFGIEMGDFYKEPVLLIKTCWGGHNLFGCFRSPSAGKAAYEIGDWPKPEDVGASYQKMVKEVRACLATLDTDFPQLKGLKTEISGFVWFQGWNDMCVGEEIKKQVYDEYCPNFVHLVQDLRAEFKVPNMPVVMGELGVGGEKADQDMTDFRAAQAKIEASPELKGTLGYVRTAPFWYSKLDELAEKLEAEEARVRSLVEPKITKKMKGKPESKNPDKMEELIGEAVEKAKETDSAYQKVKKEADKHIAHWGCHYHGSARVYCMVGYSLAEAMKPLLKTQP